MKFIIAIILISIFPILTNAQYTKTVCVDTSIVNTYSFANIPLVPFGLVTLKNNYKLVITTSLQNTNGILQIASNGDIVWHKKFNSSFPNLFLRIDKILELKKQI